MAYGFFYKSRCAAPLHKARQPAYLAIMVCNGGNLLVWPDMSAHRVSTQGQHSQPGVGTYSIAED